MAAAFGVVMRGEATPAQVAALLMALRIKGESAEEVAGAARALREAIQELADRLVEHRAAPGDRLVAALEEELDRHHAHAVVHLERNDLALRRHHRLAVHAHHAGDGVAPHVRV